MFVSIMKSPFILLLLDKLTSFFRKMEAASPKTFWEKFPKLITLYSKLILLLITRNSLLGYWF